MKPTVDPVDCTERWHASKAKGLRLRRGRETDLGSSFKPAWGRSKNNMFWWSVGRSWLDWCEAEDFNVGGYVYRVELDAAMRLLRLAGAADLDNFTTRYGTDEMIPGIEWERVAAEYDGVEIAPYCWERRLHLGTHWYYPWDCACGVVWDTRLVHIRGRAVKWKEQQCRQR